MYVVAVTLCRLSETLLCKKVNTFTLYSYTHSCHRPIWLQAYSQEEKVKPATARFRGL